MRRRDFVRTIGVGALAAASPRILLARAPTPARFVFVLLRGGMDGLAAVVPAGDPQYARVRRDMAFETGDLTPLDNDFYLAPGLAPLKAFWDRGELAVVHAMAIPYRTRSHFDGQAILETGLDTPSGSDDGWLNRLLGVMDGSGKAIAVAAGLPRSLTGDHPVTTWSPANLGTVDDAYRDRLHYLYRRDPMLADAFEASLELNDAAPSMGGRAGPRPGAGRGRMTPTLSAAARFLRDPEGPNIAAVESTGWDTHTNQGMTGGPLDRLLGELAMAMEAVRTESGEAWNRTTLVVMTEFGRTARPNGTGGTDHGTAGAGLVIGPNLAGSRVVADWPGLAEGSLHQGRDLRPTVDTRAVLKGVLGGVFDLSSAQLNRVFPGSERLGPRTELMA